MKKFLTILLALALTLTMTAAFAADGDALSRIRERGYIVFGTEGNWAPWTYFNENDELVGFDIEVAQAVAAKLGVEARFEPVEWTAIFTGIDSGMYDSAANGVDITEERMLKYDFSAPYCFNRVALIVHADNTDITSFEDLNGRRTANSTSSTYMLTAEEYGASVDSVETLSDTFSYVITKRADATLNAEASFYDYMKQQPDAPLKIAAIHPDVTEVGFPLVKGDDTASLRAEIDQAIDELRADGTLAAISNKYFGGDLTSK